MEIRDRQTGDAVAEIASLLATAYQRSRRARCIEIATHEAACLLYTSPTCCLARTAMSSIAIGFGHTWNPCCTTTRRGP